LREEQKMIFGILLIIFLVIITFILGVSHLKDEFPLNRMSKEEEEKCYSETKNYYVPSSHETKKK
jgi:hypothetical protein